MESGHLVFRETVNSTLEMSIRGKQQALTPRVSRRLTHGMKMRTTPATPLSGVSHHLSSQLTAHTPSMKAKRKEIGVFQSFSAPGAASSSCQEIAAPREGDGDGQTQAPKAGRASKQGRGRQGGPEPHTAHFLQAKSHSR